MLFWMILITALVSHMLHLDMLQQIVLFIVTYLCWSYHIFATNTDCKEICHNAVDGSIKDLKTTINMLQNKNGES